MDSGFQGVRRAIAETFDQAAEMVVSAGPGVLRFEFPRYGNADAVYAHAEPFGRGERSAKSDPRSWSTVLPIRMQAQGPLEVCTLPEGPKLVVTPAGGLIEGLAFCRYTKYGDDEELQLRLSLWEAGSEEYDPSRPPRREGRTSQPSEPKLKPETVRAVARKPYAPPANAVPESYEHVLDAFPDTESLTVLTVSGRSRDEVAAALNTDLSSPIDYASSDDETQTAWAILEVPGGVAVEPTGYGDPNLAALRSLSENGRASAVVRSNIQAHLRFGCARDGELLFDDDEFMYIEDPEVVPAEVRPLFDLAWDDLGGDVNEDDRQDGFVVGVAMAEVITGVKLTSDQVAQLYDSGFFAAPSLVYSGSLDE